MIDSIATLDETLARILTAGDATDQRAALDVAAGRDEAPIAALASPRYNDLERQVFALQL